MPDLVKKKKKEDTGTGKTPVKTTTPSVYKPGAKTTSSTKPRTTDSGTGTKSTPSSSTSTKKATGLVQKPNSSKAKQETDTGSGKNSYAKQEKSKNAKTALHQQNTGSISLEEQRKQAEASIAKANKWEKTTGQRSAYRDWVAGQKISDYKAGVDKRSMQEKIAAEQRRDKLRAWDLDAAKAERDRLQRDAEAAKNGIYNLTNQMNDYAARGDKAAVLRLNGQIQTLKEQVSRFESFERDYQEARSIQYDDKGAKQLDELKKTNAAAYKYIDDIAQFSAKDLKNLESNGGDDEDELHKLAASSSAKPMLKKMGYSDEDIEQLVDFRVRQINEENTRNLIAKAQQMAKDSAVGASLASVATNIPAGLGFVDAAIQSIAHPDRPIDYNTDAMANSVMTNAIRQQVSQDLIEGDEKYGQLKSFLYQTGMSMADSTVNMGLAAIGVPQPVGLLMMSGSAASTSLREAHERGLSDSQALTLALISGAAEYVTETVELKSLMDIIGNKKVGKNVLAAVVKDLKKQAHEEGREEVFSDIINLVGDSLVMGGESEFNNRVRDIEANGYSHEDAVKMAVWQQSKDMLMSYLGGALSGGIMGGGGSIYSNTVSHQTDTVLRGALWEGVIPENSQLRSSAEAYNLVYDMLSQTASERSTDGQIEFTAEEQAVLEQARNELMESYDQLTKEEKQKVKDAAKASRLLDKMVEKQQKAQQKEEERQRKERISGVVDEAMTSLSGQTTEQAQQTEQTKTQSKRSNKQKVFSTNEVVQQAAKWVSTGKQNNIVKAVNAVMRSTDAQQALGLSFTEEMDNTSMRTQINQALKALVENGPAQEQTQVQEQAQTQTPEATSDVSDVVPDHIGKTTYEDFAKMYRAQSGKENVPDTEIMAGWKAFVSDHFISPDNKTVWSRKAFVEDYLRKNPNATEEKANEMFDNMKRLTEQALAQKKENSYTKTKQKAEATPATPEEANTAAGAEKTEAKTQAKAEAKTKTKKEGTQRGKQVQKSEEPRTDGDGGGLGGRTDSSPRVETEGVQGEPEGNSAQSGSRGDRPGSRAQGSEGSRKSDRGGDQEKKESNGSSRRLTDKSQKAEKKTEKKTEKKAETEAKKKPEKKVPSVWSAPAYSEEHSYKTTDRVVDGNLEPLRVVDHSDMLEEDKWMITKTSKLGLRFIAVVDGVQEKNGDLFPAYTGRRKIVLSLNYNRQTKEKLYNHEFVHGVLFVSPTLREKLYEATKRAGIDKDLLIELAKDHYWRYARSYVGPNVTKKQADAIIDADPDLYIEEMLADAYAGIVRYEFNPATSEKLRKAIAPVIDQEADTIDKALHGSVTPAGRAFLDIDDEDIPDWAFEEEIDYYDDTEDIPENELDETGLYRIVKEEDVPEDVDFGSVEETEDNDINGHYHDDPGDSESAPSGLSREQVIYDPEKKAFFDKATGRKVFYDADNTQTFLYDEYADVFEEEVPPPEFRSEQRRVSRTHTPPRWTGQPSAVDDVERTPIDTQAFRDWFHDPTPNKELSKDLIGAVPKDLFHGTGVAGFTKFVRALITSSRAGGIYLSDDAETAAVYARDKNGKRNPREFKPIVAKSWRQAEHYAKLDLGMQLELSEDEDTYTLYTYNEATGLFEERATFSNDESGLRQFNDTYGEIHTVANVETPGVYRVYGTSSKALVIDAHGRNWEHVLYDPVRRQITKGGDRPHGHWWATDDIVDRAFATGYDCVIIKNVDDGAGPLNNDYIFKDPGQVKSVYNEGTWDINEHEMRYYLDEDGSTDTEIKPVFVEYATGEDVDATKYFSQKELDRAWRENTLLYDPASGVFFWDEMLFHGADELRQRVKELEEGYDLGLISLNLLFNIKCGINELNKMGIDVVTEDDTFSDPETLFYYHLEKPVQDYEADELEEYLDELDENMRMACFADEGIYFHQEFYPSVTAFINKVKDMFDELTLHQRQQIVRDLKYFGFDTWALETVGFDTDLSEADEDQSTSSTLSQLNWVVYNEDTDEISFGGQIYPSVEDFQKYLNSQFISGNWDFYDKNATSLIISLSDAEFYPPDVMSLNHTDFGGLKNWLELKRKSDDELIPLYFGDTGQFYFDGQFMSDEEEFKSVAEDFYDLYTEEQVEHIKKALLAQGFWADELIPKPKGKFDLAKAIRADGRALIPQVAHESRRAGEPTPGFSEDYGKGSTRGLEKDLVIYDAAYDTEEHATPFFERSTGKPVFYDRNSSRFRYDEVSEVLSAEDPHLVEVLIKQEHFSDFADDEYSPSALSEDVAHVGHLDPRKPLTDVEKGAVQMENRRKVSMLERIQNLRNWFHDPTPNGELSTASGMPRILYHGTAIPGYTQFTKAKLHRRGIFTTPNENTAGAYGKDMEFVPRDLTSWGQATKFVRDELGAQIYKDGDNYVFSVEDPRTHHLQALIHPLTGEVSEEITFEATEEGLKEFNAVYGELFASAEIGYGGFYRFYGTSQKAFVLDHGVDGPSGMWWTGANWKDLLFNPTGMIANPIIYEEKGTNRCDYWSTDDLADFLFSQGYDLCIVKNISDGGDTVCDDFIFRDSGQLKSIYNVGTFDRNNPDYRYYSDDGDVIEPPALSFPDQVDLALKYKLANKLKTYIKDGVTKVSGAYVSYDTPKSLVSVGLNNLPILISQGHIRSTCSTRLEDKSGHPLPGYANYHGLDPQQLKKLPALLAKPVCIIQNPGADSNLITVVTTERDFAGRNIVVVMQPNADAGYDGVNGPCNFVLTCYGWRERPDQIRGLLNMAAKQGRILFADKAKSTALMTDRGVQYGNKEFQAMKFDKVLKKFPAPAQTLHRKFYADDEVTENNAQTEDTFESLLAKAEVAYEKAHAEIGRAPNMPPRPISQMDDVMSAWIIARTRYGAIEQTGKNEREIAVPRSINGKSVVSKAASTVMGAAATPESRLTTVASAVVNGKLEHIPVSDKLAENRARAKIEKLGFQEARAEWTKAISEGKVNKDLVALGATLLNNAGNSNATGKEYIGILVDYAELARRAGQSLQAMKILKTLSPEAQLYTAQRQVDRINEELAKRGFDPTQYPNVEIDQELIDAFRRAKTEEERSEIMKQIAQNIADQIPSTAMDKFTAWRYLAMLGNFKTQVRNITGNTLMQPMRMLKADVAGLVEALISKLGGNIERTTSVARDRYTFKFAMQDFENVRDIILTGGKFDDNRKFAKEIEDRRRIFKSKLLEGYRRTTNWAMDQGDAIFCSFTYADALARFMAANHTTWEAASDELRERGREIAIKEAAEATYRDSNAFSNFIVSLRVRNPDNAVKKAAAIALEGVLPFRKTPANILARAVEYSPVGLLYSGYEAAAKAVGKSNVTGTDIVNHMAKGLTGSGLLALGFALSSLGLLVGKAPDDDKEKDQWKREGHQAYALEFAGHSYTLDWAAPVCVPLFLGSNIQEVMLSEGLSLDAALNALRTISDPVLEMSMLQGIQSLIDNAANYGDDSALVRLTADAMWSFATQVVPTWLGQVNRITKGKRMQTYSDKNKKMPGDFQYALGKLAAKIPFVNYAQIVYTDAWGRTHANADNLTVDIIQQLISPGYISTLETSDMEKELARLKKATGDSGVLISSAGKDLEYTWKDENGKSHNEKKNLTADEFLTYNTTRGQIAYRVMTELTSSSAYKALDDDAKVDAVKRVYSYATAIAKNKVVPKYELESWVVSAQDADRDFGWTESEFIMNYLKYGSSFFNRSNSSYEKTKTIVKSSVPLAVWADLKANASTDGKSGITQAEARAYLDKTNLTRSEKALLWTLIDSGWKTNPYK